MSMTQTSAVHVLVVGGLLNLVLSFALGWVLSLRRVAEPIEPNSWLLVAHTVAMQEGCFLLGLGFAISFAKLPGWLAVVAAWLLVAASMFQDFSGVVNWLKKTGDQFAEKSTGWVLASINAVLNTAGLLIVAGGVGYALLS
jgi:hypothetical protein